MTPSDENPSPPDHPLDYRALFHATPAPHVVLTPALRIAAVNDAYLEATSTTREELVGRHVFDAFPQNPDDRESRVVENLHASLVRVLKQRTADTMPLQRYDIRVSGEGGPRFVTRYWSPINTPVFDARGTLTHIVHRVIDATEFVEATAHATKLEADLTAQALEMQDANRRLRDANLQLERERELREQFVLAMSHDLRTPLSAATMGSHVIGRKADDADAVRRISTRVHANLERIDRMLRDLLDASRINAGGRLRLSPTRCDLDATVGAIVDEIGTVHGDRFHFRPLASPVGHWDCEALRRVIENLCVNAIHYGRPQGTVTVTLHEAAQQALVEVHNEGDPIPPHEQAAIFMPHFRRAEHERAGRAGWGLGLTVVRGIVEAHGGTIDVQSDADEGTTFRVRLPLDAGATRDAAAP